MACITKHSKERIVERNEDITNFEEAKRRAKIAMKSGKTIKNFKQYPKFFNYLQHKKNQTNDCTIRVYKGCIYIWRGKLKSLVTAHPIPDRYLEEMEMIDNGETIEEMEVEA